jgi:hypothetical protein
MTTATLFKSRNFLAFVAVFNFCAKHRQQDHILGFFFQILGFKVIQFIYLDLVVSFSPFTSIIKRKIKSKRKSVEMGTIFRKSIRCL